MAKPLKRLLKSAPAQALAGALIGWYTSAVTATSRHVVHNAQSPATYWSANKPVIVAIWHGRLLLMPVLFKTCPHTVYALISAHRDGRLVSHAAARNGIKTVQGSSTRGGAAAVKAMLRLAKQGNTLFITPDGPKGPRMHSHDGVLEIARMTGLPIIPVSIGTRHGKVIGSWDRFLLSRLFTTVHTVWGEALTIPRDATDLSSYKKQLEDALTTAQNMADTATDRPFIPAAKDPS